MVYSNKNCICISEIVVNRFNGPILVTNQLNTHCHKVKLPFINPNCKIWDKYLFYTDYIKIL